MVTSIQLGNIFSQNGKNVVGGSASGFDIKSLIDGLAEAKRLPAVALETKIENNSKKSTALTDLSGLLNDFKDAANFLRSPPGVNNKADNIFEYRSGVVSSNTTISGNTYLNVTAKPGAPIGEYDIKVNQLATRNNKTTDTFALTATTDSIVGSGGPFNAGTLTLGPNATEITLANGDSLDAVIGKINAVKDSSKVEASFIKVSDGNYRISFKTTETGTNMNYDLLIPAGINSTIFNIGLASENDAVDASITLDGTTITRQKNNFDDVIEDITFNLNQETPIGTNLKVKIEPDTELAKQGIINFVDAYNAFRLFASTQSETDDSGAPKDTAILSGDPTMRLSLNRIYTEMSQQVDGIVNGNFSRLSDLGIAFDDFPGDDTNPFTRNIMTVDEAALDSALATDYQGVRNVFEFGYTSDNADLQVFSRTNGLGVSDASLNIDITNGIYEATYTLDSVVTTVSLDATLQSDGTTVLKGKSGTAMEGLTMLYANSIDATVNLHFSQGIGDRLYNTVSSLVEKDSGAVDVAISALSDNNDRYTKDIADIDRTIERYRQTLLDQFSALESAISSANTLLQSLDAQANARNN